MAIYRATLSQLYRQQRIINRWYYISAGAPAAVSGSFALFFAFGREQTQPPGSLAAGSPLAGLSVIQNEAVQFVSCVVENLYQPEDFYEGIYSAPVAGLQVGEDLGPLVAFGFRTSRVTRAIRRGYKRFTGVTEDSVTSGGELTVGALAQAQVIADRMTATLTYDDEGNNLSFTPAILSFEKYTTPAGNTAYRQYATQAEQLDNAATGFFWEPYQFIRSQGSRQYGRGQ